MSINDLGGESELGEALVLSEKGLIVAGDPAKSLVLKSDVSGNLNRILGFRKVELLRFVDEFQFAVLFLKQALQRSVVLSEDGNASKNIGGDEFFEAFKRKDFDPFSVPDLSGEDFYKCVASLVGFLEIWRGVLRNSKEKVFDLLQVKANGASGFDEKISALVEKFFVSDFYEAYVNCGEILVQVKADNFHIQVLALEKRGLVAEGKDREKKILALQQQVLFLGALVSVSKFVNDRLRSKWVGVYEQLLNMSTHENFMVFIFESFKSDFSVVEVYELLKKFFPEVGAVLEDDFLQLVVWAVVTLMKHDDNKKVATREIDSGFRRYEIAKSQKQSIRKIAGLVPSPPYGIEVLPGEIMTAQKFPGGEPLLETPVAPSGGVLSNSGEWKGLEEAIPTEPAEKSDTYEGVELTRELVPANSDLLHRLGLGVEDLDGQLRVFGGSLFLNFASNLVNEQSMLDVSPLLAAVSKIDMVRDYAQFEAAVSRVVSNECYLFDFDLDDFCALHEKLEGEFFERLVLIKKQYGLLMFDENLGNLMFFAYKDLSADFDLKALKEVFGQCRSQKFVLPADERKLADLYWKDMRFAFVEQNWIDPDLAYFGK